jgi:hypothetical protein
MLSKSTNTKTTTEDLGHSGKKVLYLQRKIKSNTFVSQTRTLLKVSFASRVVATPAL